VQSHLLMQVELQVIQVKKMIFKSGVLSVNLHIVVTGGQGPCCSSSRTLPIIVITNCIGFRSALAGLRLKARVDPSFSTTKSLPAR